MELWIAPSAAEAVDRVTRLIADQVSANPTAVLALPTGRTPVGVYDLLARWQREGRVDMRRVRSFNLDELVGLLPGNPFSYTEYMLHQWVHPLGIPSAQARLPVVTGNLADNCAAYDDAIRSVGGIDLALLGIGENGHLGFNEPGTPWDTGTHVSELADSTRRALVSSFGALDAVPRQAVTMGMGTILAARHCVLLATGASKASIVARALEAEPSIAVPASALQRHARATVVVDATAAAALRGASGRQK